MRGGGGAGVFGEKDEEEEGQTLKFMILVCKRNLRFEILERFEIFCVVVGMVQCGAVRCGGVV